MMKCLSLAILGCLFLEAEAFLTSIYQVHSNSRLIGFVGTSLASKGDVSFKLLSNRLRPQNILRPLLLKSKMSALGPIGPFTPFRSSYCSSGVVEREMGELTALAETLSTKFSRMMLGFQVRRVRNLLGMMHTDVAF